MKCPACGAAEVAHETRDIPYTYKGQTAIKAVSGHYYPAFGEGITDFQESIPITTEMLALSR